MSIIITKNLGYKSELIEGPFISTQFSEMSRMIAHSDVSISIVVYWSYSKTEMTSGIPQKLMQVPKDFHRSEPITFLYPYFWIVIRKNNVQEEQTKMYIELFDPEYKQHNSPKNNLKPNEAFDLYPEKLNKGIFFKKDKKITFSSKDASRLPELLPQNSMLVGSFSNKLKIIAPPHENESILFYKDGSFEWLPISKIKF